MSRHNSINESLLSSDEITLSSDNLTDSSNSDLPNIDQPKQPAQEKSFLSETPFLDPTFLFGMDQLYNNTQSLFYMEQSPIKEPHYHFDQPQLTNSQESNYLKASVGNTIAVNESNDDCNSTTLDPSITGTMDSLESTVASFIGEQPLSIWSGLNNFFSNVTHNNLFPIALPNFARSVSEYISSHPVPFLSSFNPPPTPLENSPMSSGINYDSTMCYKREPGISTGLQIRVLGIPQTGAKSRVETQIKLCIQLVTDNGDKAQWWSHLKLPEQMITKDKTKKNLIRAVDTLQPIDLDKLLYLQARVICASDPSKKVTMCLGCIQRERKRSQRRKDSKMGSEQEESTTEDDQSYSSNKERTLLFNCAEMVDFSSGDTILPTRITCYCRHHNERIGFCILFEMINHNGEKVAEGISPPIMITDDHKSSKIKTGSKRRRTESEVPELPIPTSFNWMKTLPFNNKISDTYLSYLPQSSASSTTSDEIKPPYKHTTSHPIHQPIPLYSPSLPLNQPVMRRLIPNEAPLSGGIAITILGTDFRPGLTVMFGDTPATNIQYWSTNTLICTLPSARQPGAVVVSFKEVNLVTSESNLMIFTYLVETDRALMELALQVVGMKMTGIVEDARKIAMRIVQGSGNGDKNKKKSRPIEALDEKQP